MNRTGVTTFYDPVCGLPLFRAPVGRSFDDWEAETKEHGWPSFRSAEVAPPLVRRETFLASTTSLTFMCLLGAQVIAENVLTDVDGKTLVSSCGTKLGTNEPDESGDRFCMDLVCISGSPA